MDAKIWMWWNRMSEEEQYKYLDTIYTMEEQGIWLFKEE